MKKPDCIMCGNICPKCGEKSSKLHCCNKCNVCWL